ncbi:MAG: UbiA family prenyltransferase, partial [Chitinivibrionales bacterium]|nr:UbiA family prenyltransferase [Chitinivibrionales bacterium]
MATLSPYFRIIRPLNVALASATTALGYAISHSSPLYSRQFLLIGAAAMAVGFGNVINDISDLGADRINRPARPLPSGRLSV